MSRNKVHRIERLANRLTTEIERRIDNLALGLQGGAANPPFSVRLSAHEQLEQYTAMTPERWQEMVTKYGVSATRDYSTAMQRLGAKLYGWQPSEPYPMPPDVMDGQTAEYIGQHGVAPPLDMNRVMEKAQVYIQDAMNKVASGA